MRCTQGPCPLPLAPPPIHLPSPCARRSTIGRLDHERQWLRQSLEAQQNANAGLRADARVAGEAAAAAHQQRMGVMAENRQLKEELRTERWRVGALLVGGACIGVLAVAAGYWACRSGWLQAPGGGGGGSKGAGASVSGGARGGGRTSVAWRPGLSMKSGGLRW